VTALFVIGWGAAVLGVAAAVLARSGRTLVPAIVAGLVPGVAVWIIDPAAAGRLAGFPIAAAAFEAAAAVQAIVRRPDAVEAWLCAGARPLEALTLARSRVRPGILVAMAQIAPVLVSPPGRVEPAFLATLAGVGVASLAATLLAAARSFVDGRLADRAPDESRAPFRLRPYEPPTDVEVHETRPPE
jgi:hypothetical protein